jgi:pimeloyl-ACP methyl ester carboxylesterase
MKGFLNLATGCMICFTLLMAGCASIGGRPQPQRKPSEGIEGIWQGVLTVPGAELRVVFKISKKPDGTMTATLDSPDQGVTDIPVDEVALENSDLRLEVQSVLGVYEGKVKEDGMTIDGEWKQSGVTLPLVLKRVEEAPEVSRPQEPEKPYPYDEEEVSYENKRAEIKLAGILTLPRTEGPFPAALLISGSGPQDRNETVFGHRPFLVLADYLTRRGIAVLRVDDRGVGGSTGDVAQSTSEDFAGDVLAGIEYLKSRKDIDANQIGLIGHSEGGIIAPILATQSPDVAFIVLMAGTGLIGEEILYLQGALIRKAEGQSDEEIAEGRALQERIFAVIKHEKDSTVAKEKLRKLYAEAFEKLSEEEKKAMGDLEAYVESQIQRVLSPWFRYFLAYDPKPTLMKVKCPVLAIIGEKDLQVPPKENLQAIEEALKAGGNKHYTVKELPGLNHMFQTAETGSVSEYAKIEETISPIALKVIGNWILEQSESREE